MLVLPSAVAMVELLRDRFDPRRNFSAQSLAIRLMNSRHLRPRLHVVRRPKPYGLPQTAGMSRGKIASRHDADETSTTVSVERFPRQRMEPNQRSTQF